MGGIVAMLYAARHPGHAAGLILQSTMARFDLGRLTAGFRGVAGDDVAALARRDFGGDEVSDTAWATVFAAFGPHVPGTDELARRVQHPQLAAPGMNRLRALDAVNQLGRITSPTLVCVGDLDPVTPPSASAEIYAALPAGVGRLEVLSGAGHFPWLDDADRYWSVLRSFVATVSEVNPG
jgi:proline iminopeptidase